MPGKPRHFGHRMRVERHHRHRPGVARQRRRRRRSSGPIPAHGAGLVLDLDQQGHSGRRRSSTCGQRGDAVIGIPQLSWRISSSAPRSWPKAGLIRQPVQIVVMKDHRHPIAMTVAGRSRSRSLPPRPPRIAAGEFSGRPRGAVMQRAMRQRQAQERAGRAAAHVSGSRRSLRSRPPRRRAGLRPTRQNAHAAPRRPAPPPENPRRR
jgi:hypothetical protein